MNTALTAEISSRLEQGYNFIERLTLAGGATATIEFKFGGRSMGTLATIRSASGNVIDKGFFSTNEYARDWAISKHG